jgi:S1-C subfamily serine protease
MDNRRFGITAVIGCGVLLLLLVLLVPAAFLFFGQLGPLAPEPVIPETGPEVLATQEAIPELTPVPENETALEEPLVPEEGLGVGTTLLAALYEQTNPGVVGIAVNVQRAGRTGQGSGSGFIIDPQGYIVTNNHVIAQAQTVTVTFFDGTEVNAEIIGRDPDSDLAILLVNELPQGAIALALADSDQVTVGEWVVAIGNPFGLESTMTVGIVSALGRVIPTEVGPFNIPQAIQTDAAINPGNSGGPLINLRGEVIGVNAQILTRQGVPANIGIGFAIPANIVRRVAPVLMETGAYQWPWLGVGVSNIGLLIMQANELDNQQGAYIDEVVRGSPAGEAGLQGTTRTVNVDGLDVPVGGDIVVAVDGRPIENSNDLLVAIAQKNPGETMELTVLRNGEHIQLTATLAPRPTGATPQDDGP